MRIVIPEDTGRIRVVRAAPGEDVRLAIEADRSAPEHRQWFCFEVHEGAGREHVLSLDNASECTYGDFACCKSGNKSNTNLPVETNWSKYNF
jgi:hypothetical protein